MSTEEICNTLNVSKATIRRDIIALDAERQLRKTRGGAMAYTKTTTEDIPISFRKTLQKEEKGRIAEAALELIREGETIYLDAGTTTFELAARLSAFKNLTILTNDLDIASEIAHHTENDLIVAGGSLKKSGVTLMGMFTEKMLSELYVDKAFLAADAVSMETGFMDYNTDEIPLKRTMINNSKQHIMLCDHTKFQNTAFMSICPIFAIDLTITGKELDPKIVQKMLDAGAAVKLV